MAVKQVGISHLLLVTNNFKLFGRYSAQARAWRAGRPPIDSLAPKTKKGFSEIKIWFKMGALPVLSPTSKSAIFNGKVEVRLTGYLYNPMRPATPDGVPYSTWSSQVNSIRFDNEFPGFIYQESTLENILSNFDDNFLRF